MISRYKVKISIVLIIFFVFSKFLLSYYLCGDQEHYIKFYNSIASTSFKDVIYVQKNILSSFEFVFGYIIFLASNIFCIEKNIFISLSNCFLVFLIFKYFNEKKVNFLLLCFLIFTNFYFLVLYTGAERLKFGTIFFLLSLIYKDNKKYFFIFIFLTLFSHIQFLIIYIAIFFIYSIKSIKGAIVKKVNIYLFVLLFIFSIIVYFIMKDHIWNKFLHYANSNNYILISIIKNLPFLLISLYYCKHNKNELFCLYCFIIIASFFVGSNRLIIFSYFIMLNYVLPYKKGFNFGILITTLYFMYKGFVFVTNILKYGDGFGISV